MDTQMDAAENDWHNAITNWTWQERNNFLLNNEFMSDCAFIVQTGDDPAIRIPAHKYVLGAKSWDFYNLFYLMEAGSNEIPITDLSAEPVKVFLELVYKESADLTMDVIWDVLKLTERFSVKSLKVLCGNFLAKQITVDNVFELLDKALDYDLEEFNYRCIMALQEKKCFESGSFFEIQNKTLVYALKSDYLGANELDLYKSVYNWATRSCERNNLIVNAENIRLTLGDAFKYIRFGEMTSNEFTECFKGNFILNPQETVEILRYIADGETACTFSGKRRSVVENEFKVFDLHIYLLYGGSVFGTPVIGTPVRGMENGHCIRFTTSKPIFLVGVIMYGVKNKSSTENTTIFLEAGQTKLANTHFSTEMDGSRKTYNQIFDQMVYLASNTEYTISFYGLNTSEYYFSDNLAEFKKDHIFDGITFKCNVTEYTPFAGFIFK